MKKFVCLLLSAMMLVSVLSGCGANQKSEEELKAELRAELEAEAKKEEALREEIKAELEAEASKQNTESPEPNSSQNTQNSSGTSNNSATARKSLTNAQIEAIASDLVSGLNLFSASTPVIDAEMAEGFAYYLVFIKDKQHILDNYVSAMENLVSNDLSTKKDDKVDGRYIEALAEAIFDVNINPESVYALQPFDPALSEVKLMDVQKSGSNYTAMLNVIDMVGNPYLSMELHLSLTSQGYTRVSYLATKELANNSASLSGDVVAVEDLKAGVSFNDLTIEKVSYKTNDQLLLDLSGPLGLEGTICYDDYFGAFYFNSDSYEFAQKIKINDNNILQLPAGFVIKNENVLKAKLGQQKIDKMKSDFNYQPYAVVKIKKYSFGVKLSENYMDSAAELLEILEIRD